MRRVIVKLAFALVIVQASGCATLFTFHDNVKHWKKPGEKKIVYSGVRARNPVMPGSFYHGASVFSLVLYGYFGTVDVVLSFVFDTAFLPATVPMALVDTNRAGQYQCLCFKDTRLADHCLRYSQCERPDVILAAEGDVCRHEDLTPNQCILRYP